MTISKGMFLDTFIAILHAFTHPKTNALIGSDGNARLTGFNLVTMALEQSTIALPRQMT